MTRTWDRTTPEGDTITLTVDPTGLAASIQRVWGGREGFTGALDEFEETWAPWLAGPFDDVLEEVRAAVEGARLEADDADDAIP